MVIIRNSFDPKMGIRPAKDDQKQPDNMQPQADDLLWTARATTTAVAVGQLVVHF
jgi:hypothetical protein